MTVHSYHDDVHDHGLFLGCERCEELALHPEQLDYLMQQRLLEGRVLNSLERIAADILIREQEAAWERTHG